MYYEWKRDTKEEQQESARLMETAQNCFENKMREKLAGLDYDGLREWMRQHFYAVSILRGTKNVDKIRGILIERETSRYFHGDVFASVEMLRKKYTSDCLL